MKALAPVTSVLRESPNPQHIYCYSPGLLRLPSGRLVATMDHGMEPGHELEGPLRRKGEGGKSWQGRIYTSDDGGATWTLRACFAGLHARPFAAGGRVYVLGQAGDLVVLRSDDDGESWGELSTLTEGEEWHQSACNVLHANGCVYLVMERRTRFRLKVWAVGDFAPVLMRAPESADLTRRKSWTFASELPFYEAVDEVAMGEGFGLPWYATDPVRGVMVAPGRCCAPMGWLETNVVQFTDPDHLWHDPSGRTFHLWMRAHTGHTGLACIARVTEQGAEPGTGAMVTSLQTAPSGRKVIYVPCPGGQMRFHVLWDEPCRRFWLLSTQATDSMCRPDRLPADRYNLPNNERRRLQLHFSTNMVDWCFAGLVDAGDCELASRHYASMAVDGDDLLILSRSGDARAKSPHDGNLITFHRLPRFRELVY